MPEGRSPVPTPPSRRILLSVSLTLLAAGCVVVLRPLLSPVVWAGVLAYASWPLYCRLRMLLRGFNTSAALLMTLMMACVVVIPVVWVLFLVQGELSVAVRALAGYLTQGPRTPPSTIREIPWLGSLLQEQLLRYTSDPAELSRVASSWIRGLAAGLAALLGNIGRNFLKILLTLLTLFFLYRDGDTVIHQARLVVQRFFGDRLDRYAVTAGALTRAVLYGLLASALAQGIVAGIGYRVVGLESPTLLGVLTGVLSVVPAIGTALVWLPLSIWLLATGSIWKGLLLVAWGSVLVHPIDNLLRPLMISNATQVPFLLVMFGAIGGLTAFGMVGIFLGPLLLGVAMEVWREWAKQQELSAATLFSRDSSGTTTLTVRVRDSLRS
jgi:predicted PurR-regulated permease PerM